MACCWLLSQGGGVGSPVDAKPDAQVVPPIRSVVVACVSKASSTLRVSADNSCRYRSEFKLVWSVRGAAPALCINTNNREMTLAYVGQCPFKGTRLARPTSTKEILACADKDTGVLRWPRTGVCWWENTPVKWLAAPATVSLLEGSAGVARAPGTGAVVIDDRVIDRKVTFGDNNSASINYLNKLIVNIAVNSLAAASTVATGSTLIRLYRNQTVEITSSGYAPNTSVDVWMNSTPIKLGSTMSDANRLTSGIFGVPANIDIGNHTITISGKLYNGTTAKVSFGVEVVDTKTVAPTSTTTTTSSTTTTTVPTTTTTTLPTQTVTWSPTTALTTTQSPNTPLAASSSGDGAITYAVQSAGATGCTINSSTRVLTFTAAGSCVVRATAATTSNYLTGYVDVTFTVLAAPAFTLSSSSESKAQNVAIEGYTISSTGGTIASYAISPDQPAGLTFSTSTGLLSGTPTTEQAATAYTITATNATGTATATFTLTVTALTCATGGVCVVGDTGPGGGKVFYVQAAGGTFTCGATLSSTCKYLEAAPTSGASAWTDATYKWSGNTNTLIGANAQGTAIGTGYKNTEAMVTQLNGGNTESKAGTIARAYGGPNNLTDWHLPSKDELNQLYINRAIVGGFSSFFFWSSSESAASTAWSNFFASGSQNASGKGSTTIYVRPVRAFG